MALHRISKTTTILRQLAWRLDEEMRSVELSLNLVKTNGLPRLTNVCLSPQIKTVIFERANENLIYVC